MHNKQNKNRKSNATTFFDILQNVAIAFSFATLACNIVIAVALVPHPSPKIKRTSYELPLRRSLTFEERKLGVEEAFARVVDVDGTHARFICNDVLCDVTATSLATGRTIVQGVSIYLFFLLYGYQPEGADATARLSRFEGVGDVTSDAKVLLPPDLGATALAGIGACRVGYMTLCEDLLFFFQKRACIVDSHVLGFVDSVSGFTRTEDAVRVYAFLLFYEQLYATNVQNLKDQATKSFSTPYISRWRRCSIDSASERERRDPVEERALLASTGYNGMFAAEETLDAFVSMGCSRDGSDGMTCADVDARLHVLGFKAHASGVVDLRATAWAQAAGVAQSAEMKLTMIRADKRFPVGLPRYTREKETDLVAAVLRLFANASEALLGKLSTPSVLVTNVNVFSCRPYEISVESTHANVCDHIMLFKELDACLASHSKLRAFVGSGDAKEAVKKTCNETLGDTGASRRCRSREAILRALKTLRDTCEVYETLPPMPHFPPFPTQPPHSPPLSPPPLLQPSPSPSPQPSLQPSPPPLLQASPPPLLQPSPSPSPSPSLQPSPPPPTSISCSTIPSYDVCLSHVNCEWTEQGCSHL